MTDPTVTQEQRDVLLGIFRSGFDSGITTHTANLIAKGIGADPAHTPPWVERQARSVSQAFTGAIFNDPAVRETIADDLVRLWTTGDSPGLKSMLAHVGDAHVHGPECSGGDPS